MQKKYKIFFFMLFLFIASSMSILIAEGQGERLILDPTVSTGVLDNGLNYYIKKNKYPENKAVLRLVINAGSVLEDEDQRGMAHLIEHMAFNGTEKYKKNDIVKVLQSIGMQFGPDINAYTSFDETVYKLSIPLDKPENIDTALDILEQWAFHMSLNTKDIESERQVIQEEWRRGLGAGNRMINKAYPDIMYGSKYGERLPIGTKDSILHSSPEAIKRFYTDWYRPDLMAVVAVGDFDVQVIKDKIIKIFSPYKSKNIPRERKLSPVPDHQQMIYSLQSDPEATWTAGVLFTKFDKKEIETKTDYAYLIKRQIFQQMLNQRFSDLIENPQNPFTYANISFSDMTRVKTFESITFQSSDKNFYPAYRSILEQIRLIKEKGFTEEELNRAKKNTLSAVQQMYNNRDKVKSSSYAAEYVSYFLEQNPSPGISVEKSLYENEIPKISLKQINLLSKKWLKQDNRVLYTMAPEKKDLSPLDPIKLSAIEYEVEQSPLVEIKSHYLPTMLMEKAPSKGKISSEEYFKDIDTYQWTLSNGATVIFKETDFKKDQILFSASSPGGSSLAPNNDLLSAEFASTLVNTSGVGGFKPSDLNKILSGTNLSLSSSINSLSSSISGSSSIKDLEKLLQLNYLYFTKPNNNDQLWASYLSRLQVDLENRDASPLTQYSDMMSSVLFKGNERKKPLKKEDLGKIDQQKAYQFYLDRFAKANNFTFYIVGSIDKESLKPLVETYLASLPSQKEGETWKNNKILYSYDSEKKILKKGEEPLSYISMLYTGEFKWGKNESLIMDATSQSIEMILIEKIREEAGGTYSPSIYVLPSKIPNQQYLFQISFSCAPQRVDELSQLVKDIIADLKKQPIDDRFIEDVIQADELKLKEALKTNSFWLGSLQKNVRLGLPLNKEITESSLNQIYNKTVFQETVKKYFNEDQLLELILLPEEK